MATFLGVFIKWVFYVTKKMSGALTHERYAGDTLAKKKASVREGINNFPRLVGRPKALALLLQEATYL